MGTKGHTRRRSSIDRVIDLLADLEESQIAVLLEELNHTTSSNVPVAEAIALFEQHAGKPKRSSRSCRSPSPMRTLQAELERRHSKRMSARISSAPEPRFRSSFKLAGTEPDAAPQLYLQHPQHPQPDPQPLVSRPSSAPRPVTPLSEPPVQPTITTVTTTDITPNATPISTPPAEPADPPSPTLAPPTQPATTVPDFTAETATAATETTSTLTPTALERPPSPEPAPLAAPTPRPRSYKRISRPVCLSPTATAELHMLLLAFFNESPAASAATPATTPTSTTTTMSTPSPTTPHFTGFPPPSSFSSSSSSSCAALSSAPPLGGFRHVVVDDMDDDDLDPDRTLLGLDLLEPPPTLFPAAKFSPAVAAATPATAKTPDFVVSSRGRGLKPMPSIGSMFEAFRM